MRRRPGVTLIEVMVAIFIAGIGMLALLALFPLGAVSMAQALRNDRAASAAVTAENIALAFDLRHDINVAGGFTTPGTLPNGTTGPSNPVYVDPWGVQSGSTIVTGTTIPRVSPVFITTGANGPSRWCTLLDDITFSESPQNGIADLSTSSIQRAGWYTWAYMLQRPNAATDAVVNLSVVVYQKRPLGLAPNESLYTASGVAGANSVILSWVSGLPPAIRSNSWLLDASSLTINVPHGDFYRVINVTESGAGSIVVELERPLKYATDSMIVMQDVIDVFDRGPSWKP